MVFVLDEFIEKCVDSAEHNESQEVIREFLCEAVSDPATIIDSLGEPRLAGVDTLYCSEKLTVLNIVWAPGMSLFPHNHNMWANIGLYAGEEENNFYQRTSAGLIQNGQSLLSEKEVAPLHEDVIHGVRNPLSTLTAAIHIYGGNFFDEPRSEWDPQTLEEKPYDVEHMRAVFAEENAKLLVAG